MSSTFGVLGGPRQGWHLAVREGLPTGGGDPAPGIRRGVRGGALRGCPNKELTTLLGSCLKFSYDSKCWRGKYPNYGRKYTFFPGHSVCLSTKAAQTRQKMLRFLAVRISIFHCSAILSKFHHRSSNTPFPLSRKRQTKTGVCIGREWGITSRTFLHHFSKRIFLEKKN